MKFHGILKGYPRIKARFGRIAGYIQLVRPFTLLAPLSAGIFGVFSTTELSLSSLLLAIYVGTTLALAQATGQIINQYADAELDAIIKSYRPIPAKIIHRDEAIGIAWLTAIIAIWRAFTINTTFGTITITLIFFAVFYSLSPFSPRRIHPIFNILWMATSRGLLPVIAVWSINGNLEKALPYALIAFLWVLGFQSTKDIPDSQVDRNYGIKTIVNTYGDAGLFILMLLSTWLFMITIAITRLVLMTFLIPIAILSIYGRNKKSRVTENNYGWLGFYVGLAFFFVLMFLGELLL